MTQDSQLFYKVDQSYRKVKDESARFDWHVHVGETFFEILKNGLVVDHSYEGTYEKPILDAIKSNSNGIVEKISEKQVVNDIADHLITLESEPEDEEIRKDPFQMILREHTKYNFQQIFNALANLDEPKLFQTKLFCYEEPETAYFAVDTGAGPNAEEILVAPDKKLSADMILPLYQTYVINPYLDSLDEEDIMDMDLETEIIPIPETEEFFALMGQVPVRYFKINFD